MADVVNDERLLLHLHHHALIILEVESAGLQRGDLFRRLAGFEPHRIGLDVQFLDVARVGVHFDRRQHFAAFVIVAVGELVAGGNDFHADVAEQILVMMRPRTADKQRGFLALVPRLDLLAHRPQRQHFLRDDFLDAVRELLAVEEFGDLAQRFRRGLRADEIHLDPRNAELLLHHLRDVIDRAMAHHAVELDGVSTFSPGHN